MLWKSLRMLILFLALVCHLNSASVLGYEDSSGLFLLQRKAGLSKSDATLSFPMPEEKRHQACINRAYDTGKMPTVSIVIPYLNENYTLIKNTVHSLLVNTPPELLDEILLVDDANDESHGYVKEIRAIHPKVKVHHNEHREGLIKAKVTGASLTTSPVIVFLEPHCIANRQWLEPLLVHLQSNPTSVAIPVIDIIPEEDTNAYTYVDPQWGGFDWALDFDWHGSNFLRNMSWRDPDPFPMPAMSGGLFAIRRDWWERSGTYDTQMTEWGGENVEMSLRIWRCGGSMFALPCSRVGHMFRATRPYEFHGEASYANSQRVAKVWLDNHISNASLSDVNPKIVGSVADRLALKERLGCKSMDWYLDNIYPELKLLQKEGCSDPRTMHQEMTRGTDDSDEDDEEDEEESEEAEGSEEAEDSEDKGVHAALPQIDEESEDTDEFDSQEASEAAEDSEDAMDDESEGEEASEAADDSENAGDSEDMEEASEAADSEDAAEGEESLQ